MASEGVLTPKVKHYTRCLNAVWCGFTFLNFTLSAASGFMSDNIWMLYNGFISYILTGILFFGEYILRTVLKKQGK